MSMNLHPEPATSKKSKSYKKSLRVGGAISLIGVGSTFAANISLNNDQNVEFGQGVAQTAACDSDGFTVTPVSYYDNTSGTFRLDYLEVSGLNLIPVGADATSYAGGSYASYSDASAIAAHPGQYHDGSGWVNTCDQVVLDFKAYTTDDRYSTNTLDGFNAVQASSSATPNTISSPLLWAVAEHDGIVRGTSEDYSGQTAGSNPNMAVIFNAATNSTNSGVLTASNNHWGFGIEYPDQYLAQSSFRLFTNSGHYDDNNIGENSDDPAAGPISKITVESMKYFPTDYYLFDTSPGALGIKQD